MHSKGLFVALTLHLIIGVLSQSCTISQSARTDCGYAGITQQQCQSKGCCWQPVKILTPDRADQN